MKKNTDLMDKAIKEKFDGHEVPVPTHIWNSIESNLPPQNDNTGGSFFFKSPFVISILLISIAIIGVYIYNYSNKQSAHSASLFNKTNTITHSINNSALTHTNSGSYDQYFSKEKKSTGNATLYYNGSKDKNKSTASSSNMALRTRLNIDVSKKQETTITPTKTDYKTIYPSANKENKASVKNNLTINESYKNTLNTNTQPHSVNKKNTAEASTFNQASLSNTSSEDIPTKPTTKSSSSQATHNTANQTESTKTTIHANNTTIQTSNTAYLKNNIPIAAHADSINIYTSAVMQKNNSTNNIDNQNSNLTAEPKISIENTKADNTDASTSNQPIHSNTSHIISTLLSLDSIHTSTNPSEIAALNNQLTDVHEADIFNAITQTAIPNSNVDKAYSSTHVKVIDRTNNGSSLEDSFNLNSQSIDTSNYFSSTKKVSTIDLALKIDSLIMNVHIDTNSVQKPTETVEVKSSDDAKKKPSLFLSRCSFDGYATPALGYIYLSSNSNQESIHESTRERNKNADAGFGFTSGMRMNYALTQKIEIGIGFQYSSLSQQTSFKQQQVDSSYATYQGYNIIDTTYDTINQPIYTSRFVVTDTTKIDFTSTNSKTYTDKFQNFSIPIHIAYGYSISNKLSLLARTSLLINFQTHSVTYFNGTDNTIIGYSSNKNISLGGSFSVGCYYQFSRNYSVFAEPIISYYFSNVFDKQAPFKQRQLMLGLQTGIRLSF